MSSLRASNSTALAEWVRSPEGTRAQHLVVDSPAESIALGVVAAARRHDLWLPRIRPQHVTRCASTMISS